MSRWPAERKGEIPLAVQLLSLIRLRWNACACTSCPWRRPQLGDAGGLHPRRAAITAVLAALAAMLYFTVKTTLTVWTAALNVAVVVYKLV